MSGGNWNYIGAEIESAMAEICTDKTVQTRWPLIAGVFSALGPIFKVIEHDMDYDISGDQSIGISRDQSISGDSAWEQKRFAEVLDAMLKLAPDEWFPRGKWATIQAVQQRVEKGQPK